MLLWTLIAWFHCFMINTTCPWLEYFTTPFILFFKICFSHLCLRIEACFFSYSMLIQACSFGHSDSMNTLISWPWIVSKLTIRSTLLYWLTGLGGGSTANGGSNGQKKVRGHPGKENTMLMSANDIFIVDGFLFAVIFSKYIFSLIDLEPWNDLLDTL